MRENDLPSVNANEAADRAREVYRLLAGAGASLVTAESCTGGLVAHLLTNVPGISEVYLAGCVAYSNESKIRDLGVSKETLEKHGAVSVETAEEMAEGARSRAGADYAVATTGIAGPTGGTEGKPVGTVCFAVAGPSGTVSRKILLPGGREEVKNRAASTALGILKDEILRETSQDS